ncbi:hypothetical protein [Pedobacter steynii]
MNWSQFATSSLHYTTYPDLLHGKIIMLEDISSYLLMTVKTLHMLRKKLIEMGKLPDKA